MLQIFAGRHTSLGFLAVAVVILLGCSRAQANSISVTGAMNWSTISTGSGSGGLPGSGDDITVDQGATLTVDVAAGVCNSIQLGSISFNGTLAFNAGSQITVVASVTFGNGTSLGTVDMTNGGTLICDQFMAGGTVVFTPGAGTVAFTGTFTLPTNFSNFNNLSVNAGLTLLGAATTVSGALTIASSATLGNNANTLNVSGATTTDGTLHINGGAFNPHATTVSGTGTLSFTGTPTTTFFGLLTVASGGTFTDTGTAVHDFRGGLTVNGTFNSSASSSYTFDTNEMFSGTATFPTLTIGNGKQLTNSGNLTVTNLQGSGGGESFDQNVGSTLNVSGAITLLSSFDAGGTGNTVNYFGSNAQTIISAQYKNLSIAGARGANSITLPATFSVSGNVNTTATFAGGGFMTTGSTMTLNGTSPQNFSGGASTLVTGDLVLANNTGYTLSASIAINGNLQFGMGKFTTGMFNEVFILAPGTTSGGNSSSYVIGNLKKFFNTGSGISFNYSVGDATTFAPVAVSNFNVTAPGALTITTTAGNHPQIATSSLDPTKTAARFWSIIPGGTAGTFDAVFNFIPGDVSAGNPNNFIVRRFNAGSWFSATTGAKTATSTQSTGIDSTALGDFQLGEFSPLGPPVLTSGGVTITGEPVVGQQLTFNGAATDPNGLPLTYNWDFGDGASGNGAFVQHVYNLAGTFTITLLVTDGAQSASLPIPITIIAPAPGADGIPNIGQNDAPVTNVLNGISISIEFSDGGVIGLSIDINALLRTAFNVSTDFSGVGGSIGTRTGTNPIMQFTQPGVFVATTSASDTATSVVAGQARKSLALSNREVGLSVRYKNEPASSSIKTGKIGGKFAFSKSGAASTGKADLVTYSGTFELPEGLDVTSKPTLSLGIGNIVDSVTIDSKGKGTGATATGFIKKVQMKFPKLANGVTTAGQTATFQVSMSGIDLSTKGFNTEGITGSVLSTEKSLKSVPRSIQVAMVFAGAAYNATANVSFKLSSKGDSGSIGTRK